MDDEFLRAVTALAHRLVNLASRDDDLRNELRSLASAILQATDRPSPQVMTPESSRHVPNGDGVAPAAPEITLPVAEVPSIPVVTEPIVVASELPELTLGRSRPPEVEARPGPAQAPVKASTSDAELAAVEARCRLKAEGIRWASTRRRRIDEGADFRVEIAPRDREILDRARDLDGYLWMNSPEFTFPRESSLLEDAAGCFEAVADAVTLVRAMTPDLEANREFLEPALDVLAEAQSALRVAVDRLDGPNDPDQFRVYDWLRAIAAREQIYIRRHMRLDDPAEPSLLPRIEHRIESLDAKFQEVRQKGKRKKSHLNRLRYHAKLIGEGSGVDHDWRKVFGAVDEMIGEGVPPSSVEIREVLLPILDVMPPDLVEPSPRFGLVLREIDRFLSVRMSPQEVTTAEVPTPEVARTARLLGGKGVVVIGGNRRPEAYEALKAAFNLKDLVWIETREHESIDRFEPYVARPEVALVLLAIRWASHSFGDVKRFCDNYGKPIVRLPAGYNPNQVAVQILAQCSGQLEEAFKG